MDGLRAVSPTRTSVETAAPLPARAVHSPQAAQTHRPPHTSAPLDNPHSQANPPTTPGASQNPGKRTARTERAPQQPASTIRTLSALTIAAHPCAADATHPGRMALGALHFPLRWTRALRMGEEGRADVTIAEAIGRALPSIRSTKQLDSDAGGGWEPRFFGPRWVCMDRRKRDLRASSGGEARQRQRGVR